MKSTGKAESVLACPLDACLRLVQEDLTTFLSGTPEYWPCISFTSHYCWSIFLLFHCKQCVIAACKWDRVRKCLQTELRLFSSFVQRLEGILPWEDEGQTSQQTSFLQGLFSVFNPRYFLFKFKRKSDWIFKLLLNCLLKYKGGGGECTPHKVFLIFFFSRIKHQHLTFSVAVRLSLAQILRQV